MKSTLTVWMLQTGEPLPGDTGTPRPMRAINLAHALTAAGHRVVLWSSSFSHQDKRHRVTGSRRRQLSPLLELRLIDSPGYRRNIGLGRLWDHAVMARNLARELRAEACLPDVAFVGFPPIETAAVMTRWLARRSIPCLLDVKDQWPEIFVHALPVLVRPLGRVLLAPYFYFARRAMRDATALSAMADSFLEWATDFCGRPRRGSDRVVPLTAPQAHGTGDALDAAARWWDDHGVLNDGTPRIMFVGSHSQAFDMEAVALAVAEMAEANLRCQFVLCGAGDCTAQWQSRMAGLNQVVFPGWIDQTKIQALAGRSLAALAPYRNSADFMMSIPNKVLDALALGLPVLSPLRGEVEALIHMHGVGMVYGHVPGCSLRGCIDRLIGDRQLREQMSSRARHLYAERFAFDKVYAGLVAALEALADRRAVP